jgi:3-oxoacyl-ACP reductase-like protein
VRLDDDPASGRNLLGGDDMSIFGTIMGKIMGHSARSQAAAENAARPAAPVAAAPAAAAASASATAVATPLAAVDVAARLDEMKAASKQNLDWRHSIVDLMKLVGIDSDITNRRALANELGYTGDLNDSATMNVWLHKQVMQKLAENGGSVPGNLLD